MKRQIFVVFMFLSLFVLSNIAKAELYQYEGKDGEIIFTTEPRKDLKLISVMQGSAKPKPKARSAPRSAQTRLAYDERAYDAIIADASRAYNIPEAFIRAVIKIESNYNPNAVSSAGAMGLMQLMPATAEHMGVKDSFDPRDNIFGGTKYLRRLADRYNGDINLVLSGYHAGPGNVEKYQGIPFAKTQNYVKNVYHYYKLYQKREKEQREGEP
ncbi:MAG: lytic transglycosylase domain-containing protein [Bradymonadales bacterium]|jgi:soluble lytic murein transglycosylase-like protein